MRWKVEALASEEKGNYRAIDKAHHVPVLR